jgi:tetratricopeptide (TPR) repeat protein
MRSKSPDVTQEAARAADLIRARWLPMTVAALLLAGIVLATFGRALSAGFINLDDDLYVSANQHVQQGLTGPEIAWAWTSNYLGYEIPLTWMSYMLDTDLFGTGPRGYHLTNVILHAANAVLLLIVLQRASGSIWRAALVAALWAVHPLRVESVAWVTERKDVLAGFFAMATLYAYIRYAQSPNSGWFAAVVLGYCLSLLSKPPLGAALPISLWLLDFWPLGRMAGGPEPVAPAMASADRTSPPRKSRQRLARPPAAVRKRRPVALAIEKWPLAAAAIIAGIILTIGIKREAQFKGDVYVPWAGRVANAVVAPVRILERFVWFRELAVVYPLPSGWPAATVAGAAALLLGVSLLAFWQRKRFPWLAVGWFWFAVNIAPSLGLVQGGLKVAMGDRYTYLPAIGLLVMGVWSIPDDWVRTVPTRIATAAFAAALLVLLMLCTWAQLGYWQNSIALFRHVLAVTDDNWMAHHDLAIALSDQGRNDEALEQFNQGLGINPNYEYAWENAAILLNRMKRWADAAEYAAHAIALEPDAIKAHIALETALMKLTRWEQGVQACQAILRLDPGSVDAHMDMAIALLRLGRPREGIAEFEKAVELDPANPVARDYLERARAQFQNRQSIPAANGPASRSASAP